jgi:WD40 repeat protein
VLGAAAVAGACIPAEALAQAPERASIAYTLSVGGGHSELFLIRSDGSGRKRLTGGSGPLSAAGASVSEPAWSPDGARLVYTRAKNFDAQSSIRTIDLASGTTLTLTSGRYDFGPAWSPDGARIAFARSSDDGSAIFAIASGGGALRRLTAKSRTHFDLEPAWSPDGSTIAFTRITYRIKAKRIDQDVFVMGADGGGLHRLAAAATSPAWSPDGARIAFVSDRDHNGETCFEECSFNGELYVMAADGSAQQRLTRTKGDDRNPEWSPDGARIAFDSDRNSPESTDGGGRELYSIAADGSCMTWLTNGGADSIDAVWQPGAVGSTDPGPGCGATMRPPTHDFDFDIAALRSFGRYPLYWLGPEYGNLLLSYLDGNDPFYTDCGSYNAGDCPLRIEVQNRSICTQHPFAYGGGRGGGETGPDFFDTDGTLASRRFAYRGAIVAEYPSSGGGWDIYTGATGLTVWGVGDAPRDIKPVVRALRPVLGGAAPGSSGSPLPAPAFPDVFWRKLRHFERVYRRLGNEAAAGRALRVTRRAVHDKLSLGRLLRKLGATRHTHC